MLSFFFFFLMSLSVSCLWNCISIFWRLLGGTVAVDMGRWKQHSHPLSGLWLSPSIGLVVQGGAVESERFGALMIWVAWANNSPFWAFVFFHLLNGYIISAWSLIKIKWYTDKEIQWSSIAFLRSHIYEMIQVSWFFFFWLVDILWLGYVFLKGVRERRFWLGCWCWKGWIPENHVPALWTYTSTHMALA